MRTNHTTEQRVKALYDMLKGNPSGVTMSEFTAAEGITYQRGAQIKRALVKELASTPEAIATNRPPDGGEYPMRLVNVVVDLQKTFERLQRTLKSKGESLKWYAQSGEAMAVTPAEVREQTSLVINIEAMVKQLENLLA